METNDRCRKLLDRIEGNYQRLDEQLRELEERLPEIPTPEQFTSEDAGAQTLPLGKSRRRKQRKPR